MSLGPLDSDNDADHTLPEKKGLSVRDVSVGPMRDENMRGFNVGLETGWGVRELAPMLQEPPLGAVRVLAVRHGMGRHNDLSGVLSVFNRDASLNDVGRAQAHATGRVLEESGITDSFDLVVVSPFTRALQTAAGILGRNADRIPTVVQPLCAEHTLLRSALQQGDRGSTAEELARAFPPDRFPQYNFTSLSEYCSQRGIEDGSWWLHCAGEWHETQAGFEVRCAEFRRWLGEECARRGARKVLLVTHGGLLRDGFKWMAPKNAECRTIDVLRNGSYLFPASVEARVGSVGIDGVEIRGRTTFYQVRVGQQHVVLRRYSDFLALKQLLEKYGKDSFGGIFPSKLSWGDRQAKLLAWLQEVVLVHGDSLLRAFLVADMKS